MTRNFSSEPCKLVNNNIAQEITSFVCTNRKNLSFSSFGIVLVYDQLTIEKEFLN